MAVQFFDSEFHIFDRRFPLSKNYFYQLDSFTVAEYQSKLSQDLPILQLEGGAIVSHRLQRFDQSYLLDALEKLGETYIGITQLPTDYAESAIESLHRQRVRGVKFELTANDLKRKIVISDFVKRVYDLVGWRVELIIDANDWNDWSAMVAELVQTVPTLVSLNGSWLSFSQEVFDLVAKGVRIKIIDTALDSSHIIALLKKLLSINSESVLIATGLPDLEEGNQKIWLNSTTLPLILDTFDDADTSRMLVQNAQRFYGFKSLLSESTVV
ncbi:MAG: hypothetical protein H3C43_07020 [Leptonema sp. (in: Bacteria)]|nr:hypothetical protein [Leptonema sp. (in: bacteria)]